MSFTDRLRARRQEMNNEPPSATPPIPTEAPRQVSESLAVQQNSQPNPRAELTNLKTTLTQDLTSDLTLEERTVRFFSVITQGIPYVGDNPIMRQLLKALGPLLTNELAKMNHDELERIYQSMFVALGQVYAPGALTIVVDLHQQHVLIEQVAIATNRPELLALPEFDALPPPAELDENVSEPEPLSGEVIVPAPPRDMVQSADDDDPLVGIEIDGVTYAVKQSEAEALRVAGLQTRAAQR